MTLRHELFELDARFGDIGDGGLFPVLERSGTPLETRAPGLGSVDAAETAPPSGSRAKLRGAMVRRLSRHRDRYRCQWDWIWDLAGERMLRLEDPFEVEEQWQPAPRASWRRLRNA
jgi:hypothetical protein